MIKNTIFVFYKVRDINRMSQTLPITLSPGHFLDLLLMGNEGSTY